jgi:hypothetical protein
MGKEDLTSFLKGAFPYNFHDIKTVPTQNDIYFAEENC